MEVIGSIGGALIGSSATKSAAKTQANAANAATAEQKRQFDLQYTDQAPYRAAGVDALSQLSAFQEPSTSAYDVMNEPGYQFGLQQGLGSVEGSAAARGGLYSGNAMKELTQYGNDYATTKYGDAFNRTQAAAGNRWNRLAGLAGIGQTATQQSAQAGQNYANQAGQIGMSNANAQGAAGMQRGQIWGNALGQLGSYGNRQGWGSGWFGNQSGMYSDPTQIPMQPGGGY
jgi:hypothetical protein